MAYVDKAIYDVKVPLNLHSDMEHPTFSVVGWDLAYQDAKTDKKDDCGPTRFSIKGGFARKFTSSRLSLWKGCRHVETEVYLRNGRDFGVSVEFMRTVEEIFPSNSATRK